MASFSAFPGRNLGTLAALILMVSPVRGLRPVRSARFPTENVPKPTRDTVPPFFKVFLTASNVDSKARVAAALEISASLAMYSINSVLFTRCLLKMHILAPLAPGYRLAMAAILDGFLENF